MKAGKTLTALAAELERQKNAKRDYLADTRKVEIKSNGHSDLVIEGIDGQFALTDHAHSQLRERLNIPAAYYERLRREQPALLDVNVNTLLRAKPETRMIRTLDQKARAYLSNSYRRLDHWDLAEAVLPVLNDDQLEVRSCEVTESKLYLKVVSPQQELEVKPGDAVRAGMLISNSEIGEGALAVSPFVERLVCTNGMVCDSYSQKKYHVGRREEHTEMFTQQTLRDDDRALFGKIRDTIRGILTGGFFASIVAEMQKAATEFIKQDPVKAVELTAEHFHFNEEERGSILRHLISGADLSRWGLANAVTRTGEEQKSYDRATELESAGGRVITLDQSAWKHIAGGE